MEKVKKTLAYCIDGFKSDRTLPMGHYGFIVTVDKDIVNQIIQGAKRDPKVALNKMLLTNLKNSFNKDCTIREPEYFQDSWLLTGLVVPGNCACFGLDGDTKEQLARGTLMDIGYTCHNIDSPGQAGALLSTWLMWFNHLVSVTDYELPRYRGL